ncbi:MAG: type II toxin-antitoxin system VapC family toxin [Gemmatimonadales bacterium]|nr:type II toxin-antitoxin system VapC family toxin [Gemmatimonadales bacterium]
MNLLLDTHIWIWSLLEPEQLGPELREALESVGSELWLSPVSVWETVMLIERGRLQVPGDAADWIDRMIRRAPIREAPFTFEVALESRRAGLAHQDPADRLLAATAKVHGLTLVTADERLLSGQGYQVRPHR